MSDAGATAQPTLGPTLLRATLLVAGLAAAGWALRSVPMRDFAAHTATLPPLAFIALAAIACASGLPRQLVAFAAGYAHGAWLGAAFALAAQLLGCTADYLWARLIARNWVRARLHGRFGARLARLDRVLAAHPFSATLTLRLLPIGNNLALNLLAGAFAVRAAAFIAASAIGYLPQTAVFALLGSGVRVAHGAQFALGAAMLAASIASGLILLRRSRALS